MTDLMKLTKAQLVKLLTNKEPTKELEEYSPFPIKPKCPFTKMGKLEYHRWRVRLLTYRIDNDNGVHNIQYINQDKRNRVHEMKEFIKWYEILIKESHKEAEPFEKLYMEYTGFIGPADKRLAIKIIKPNYSDK